MRAPSTSDVRQRTSTNAELPVDGLDDQLTSDGRPAAAPIYPALVIYCALLFTALTFIFGLTGLTSLTPHTTL